MNRLLQGDVGSGKGLVAQLAALMVVGGGSQAAMVAPDALSAERRYLHIDPILRSIGIKTMLVTEEHLDRAQLDAIRRGEAQIVFGTRAILQKAVNWKRLGLVTVEERGPYGLIDLDALGRRGLRPDLLVIPRAPIPSSLAFTVFGDFDVSSLHAPARPPVECEVFANAAREDAYGRMREVIESGRQGYVVFPVRDGRDLLSVSDAMRTAQALQVNLLPGTRIGVYSSEMSRDERGRVFEDFQNRRIDVLVCTTYIEDSPTVANATAMVVEYADLHDLVRLHRLRAHVGAGFKSGLCAFVASESPDEKQIDRLDQLLRERDGFRLAELDLRFRGASAILGDRATEAPSFVWADPPEDRGLFMRARAAAFDLVRKDPELRAAGGVASTVNLRWSEWLGHALPKNPSKKKGDGRRRRRKRR
jgi:ATP-dependent DNA helicase RecG